MLLTVLTPTLNCGKTLNETLRSVEMLHALFPNAIQHLIGDGGSTDDSVDILAEYTRANCWAKVQTLCGLNIPETLNILLREAKGQWVTVLNGDDYYDNLGMLGILKSIDISAPPFILCGHVGVQSIDGIQLGVRGCNLENLSHFMSVNHPAMLVDSRVFNLIGVYDSNVPSAYDYIWTWDAYRAKIPFEVVNTVLAHARLGGISQNRADRAAKEILEAKITRGCILPAWRNFVVYKAKKTFRTMLPVKFVKTFTAYYRKATSSIDAY